MKFSKKHFFCILITLLFLHTVSAFGFKPLTPPSPNFGFENGIGNAMSGSDSDKKKSEFKVSSGIGFLTCEEQNATLFEAQLSYTTKKQPCSSCRFWRRF